VWNVARASSSRKTNLQTGAQVGCARHFIVDAQTGRAKGRGEFVEALETRDTWAAHSEGRTDARWAQR
jgi:hypothetical protein